MILYPAPSTLDVFVPFTFKSVRHDVVGAFKIQNDLATGHHEPPHCASLKPDFLFCFFFNSFTNLPSFLTFIFFRAGRVWLYG